MNKILLFSIVTLSSVSFSCDPWESLDLVSGDMNKYVGDILDDSFYKSSAEKTSKLDTNLYLLSILNYAYTEHRKHVAETKGDNLWTGAGLSEFQGIKANAVLAGKSNYNIFDILYSEFYGEKSGSTAHSNIKYFLNTDGKNEVGLTAFYDELLKPGLPANSFSYTPSNTFMMNMDTKITNTINFNFPMTAYVDISYYKFTDNLYTNPFESLNNPKIDGIYMYVLRRKNDRADDQFFASFDDMINVNIVFGLVDDQKNFIKFPELNAYSVAIWATYIKAGGMGQEADPKDVLNGLLENPKSLEASILKDLAKIKDRNKAVL